MKTKLLLAVALAVCVVAAPASADLFTFTLGTLKTSYDTGTQIFTADEIEGTTNAIMSRLTAPLTSAYFDSSWGGPEDFTLTMNISGISPGGDAASGAGSFAFTDIDGDIISGSLSGNWFTDVQDVLKFEGLLSGVNYTPSSGGETTFNGDLGTLASMVFGGPTPWLGSIVELTHSGLSFNTGWTDINGSGLTATVVPVPAAVIMGILGLGVAGWRLRRFA
jgi:hypothetical protein